MKHIQLVRYNVGSQYQNPLVLDLQKQKAKMTASFLANEIKFDDRMSLM